MNKRLVLLILPLILLAAVFAGASYVLPVRAAPVGLVCMNDALTAPAPPANPCPAAATVPYTFEGPSPQPALQVAQTLIRIGIYINGSDALNGFDITVKSANVAVLSPFGIDLTGTALPGTSNTIVVECINGVLISGSVCAGATDVQGTIHLSVVGGLGLLSTPPTSGLLVTTIWNITGTAPTGGVAITYQTGCNGTSVPPNTCVTVSNGSTTPVPELVQTGDIFDNSGNALTIPWVAMSTTAATQITTTVGAVITAPITATSQNFWPPIGIVDSIAFTATASGGFTAPTFSAASCVTAGTTCSVTATFNTAKAGTYIVTVFGSYGTTDGTNAPTFSLMGPINFRIVVQDVAWLINGAPSANAVTTNVPKGYVLSLNMTVTSLGGFSGTVTFLRGAFSAGTTGAVDAYPAAFPLAAGQTITNKIVTLTVSNYGLAQWQIRMTAGTISRLSGLWRVNVNGISITPATTTVTFAAPGSGSDTVTLKSLGLGTTAFAGPVIVNATATPNTGLGISCPSPVTLVAGGTGTSACTFTSSTPGTYSVTIRLFGGYLAPNGVYAITNSTTISVIVTGGVASPSISTVIKDTTNTMVTSVVIGTTVHDTSTITGGSTSGVTGSVVYNFFSNFVCSGTPSTTQTVTVTAGVVPDSAATTPATPGSYSYNATYSGDANNNPAKSTCEQLTVSKTSPTIATTVSATSIIVGTTASDSSTLSGSFSAGGTVTYSVFSNGACTGTGAVASIVTVTGGVVPNSRAVTFNATGSFAFQAVYSGDANNNGATSACEPLTVIKASPTITTTVSSTSIMVGTTASDSSVLSGGFQASGTVTYSVFSNGACTGTGAVASVVTVTGGIVPNSRLVTFNATGSFAFQAVYSGDANNNAATSLCEPLTVNKATPTIATTVSSTSITVGTSASDSSTLSGAFQATGTVTYNVFSNGACTGTGAVASIVTVTGGIVPSSRAVTFNATGSFAFNAVYSGDANNVGTTSACEPLTVNKTNPTIATTVSSTSITVGTTASDSSTLSGSFNAGGTVTYSVFSNGACTGTGAVASVVTVTGGIVPNSRLVTFNATGSFAFNAVYSGDANNNAATSACEPLTVNKTNPAIATTLSSTSPIVGTTVTDSSVLSAAFQASGTVTYSVFSNGACTGTGTVASVVTVTGGVVPNSRAVTFNATGAFAFRAVYSGDANNNGAPSACEPLTVIKASPTIATTVSATTITVGTTASDSSVLSGSFQATGTVTYNVFSNGACTGTGTAASVVTVTGGVVPNSRAVTFNATGAFAFNAVYSGDANNNGATSSCEPLTVQKASPALATSLSSTTPVVGTTVTDSSTLTNGFQASGTVTYTVFANGACTAPGTVVSTVTVTGGVVPNSRAVLFNSTGAFAFQASYSGDANNNVATSACEPLTVQRASPSIATSLSSTSPIVGTTVTDSSTLTGGFQAGGTVTYNVFSNGACTGTATVASIVTVTGGIVPNSRAVRFNATGAFAFNAVYSGDANNNGATSACEPLTVIKITPTIATALSSTSPIVGTTVTDSSTLSNSFNAGGTVTYSVFSNGACTGTGVVASTVTVTGGIVPNSRAVTFNATGSFSFNAVYSGDANNNGAPSACEPLTVIKASPTIATTVSATTITVGTTASDSSVLSGSFQATGTVTYNVFSNGACTGTGAVASVVTVAGGVVPNSRAVTFNATGSFAFQAVYSGDANNNAATSACEPLTVAKASPTLATSLSSTSPVVGTTVTDSSTLTGGFQASGTVTYSVFSNGACTGTGAVASVVTVTGGIVPNSRAVTFNATGAFAFQAVYSGDANNNVATSACEPLTVQKASPSIATSLSSTSPIVGTTVTDSSTLTSGFQASGTVTYTVFTNGACTAPGTVASIVTVTGGIVPNSRAVRFNATGTYSFIAVYSGDANNNGSTSACEPLTVIKISPTIATSVSATSIIVGTSASDSSTLANSFSAGGTVTYSVFSNGTCTGTGAVASVVTVTGGIVPNSRAVTFNATGTFAFNAVYSGDANNNGATSACEPLTVNKTNPTIATVLSSTSPVVGTTVTDSSTLSNSFTAGGTVTYNVFSNGACTGTGVVASTVTVTGGIVPNSRAVTFNATGSFSFNAVYSGDANNNAATSACEPLTVIKITPTLATSLSSTSPIVGTSVTDSATLTNSFNAGGTVTYTVFANGACTAPGTVVSTVTVTAGVVPNSRAVLFNSTGAFAFQASYSGDANNNVATSACEPLTVQRASPTIATVVSSTSIVVGTTVTDSSTLSNSFNAGGTVTYNVFSNGACTGTGAVASTVTVTGGIVPNSRAVRFNATGSFSFNAVYSGDANNNGATSACEPLTVIKASPTIATTVSATTINVGTTASDSSTLTGGFSAGGTVTYSVFSNGTCTGTGAVASTVTVTGGVVPNSRAVTFNATGSFAFQAVYSGDANNNGATSLCEPLTVQRVSPTIATTLSATTITVGTTISDSSSLSGAFQATGTVTYNLFTTGTCSGTATVVSTVTVTGGIVPNSRAVQINATGSFSFNAVYSGDSNNNGATSACEPFTVAKTVTTIATTLSATTITVGGSASDSSTLTGGFQAGGTVTYSFFTGGTCTGTGTIVSTVTVTNGVIPNSASQTFNSAGSFSWNAAYSGDANNGASTSACEPLTVSKASPSLTTLLSTTTPVVGTTVTDSATLTGGFSATGTVTYSLFANGTCTGTGSTVSTVTVTAGTVPNSRAVTFNSTGSFAFSASYSGDANNNVAASTCEPLTVQKASPTIATTVSSTSITVGTTASDSSVLTGAFQATGTVTYSVFSNGTCTGTGAVASVVTVTGGVVPNSRAVTFNATGSFAFRAVYSGDANNNVATSPCEPLTVNKASPTISTVLSATTITVSQTVTDSSTIASGFQASGTVTYSVFSNGTCTGTGAVASTVTVTGGVVPNSRAVTFNASGSFAFQAVYSGDANNNAATSACEPLTVNPAGVAIGTSLSATTVVVGGSVFDTATLTGTTATAGGTVTYQLFASGTCAGTASTVSIVTVTNGIVPNSRSVTFNATGSFGFKAVYSGDANNSPATSLCEPLTVSKATPTIATTVSSTSITVGTTASDSSVLSGAFQATGTVTYSVFSNGTCTGTGAVASVVTVTGGVVPNSRAVTFNATGSFAFQAVYSGDANNNGATSACEPLTVIKASPSISTTLSSTTPIVGTSVTDSSTLTGGFSAAGTVTYTVFNNGLCSAPGTVASVVTVTGGVVPNSRAVTFNSTGSFSFNAAYSGDANNNVATSACEPLTVQKASPSISTVVSSTTVVAGTSASDSSTITGGFQVSGTVTYSLFTNGACTGTGAVVSTVTVAGGVVPNSRAVTFNATGSYAFQASYSGDSNNNVATSACEPLTVIRTTPSIATTLSQTTITVGQSVTDSATLSSSFQASGTVTYSVFTNGVCTGTGTVVSTVTVTAGVVPNSRAVTFNASGSFAFQAAYSGDANNNAATSACEPLTVNPVGTSVATTLSATSITVGGSVSDSATLSGTTATAGGTVTYQLFTSGTCAGTASTVSIVTVTNGVVPNSRSVTFNATGSFGFKAVYSGDANNGGATSPCEPLTVSKATPAIATTLSATTITVGGSASDSSTITGGFQVTGTVTYNVFANGSCTGTSSVASIVTITGGVVPNSRAVTFNATGSFAFNAVYSGDANNNAATSACEALTVQRATPSIATSLSSTSPVVGTTVTDSSTLTGGFQGSGTVTYSVFSNGACTGTGAVASIVTVTGGIVPNSRAVTFNATGAFAFQAVYSGDSNNNGATSACEPLTVIKTSPSISTTLSATTIQVGQSVTDSASLTSSFQAGGTVIYTLFTNGACTAPGSAVSTVTVTGGVVPNSRAVRFNVTGSYSFNAVYSGDANNNAATSACEPLVVNPTTGVTIATTLSATTITPGGSITDSATLSGQTATASGTVTYNVFTNGSCTGTGTVASVVTVTNGVVPNSRAVTFNSTGSYAFNAVYSGDANNNAATSACEPLSVIKVSPSIATSLSSTSPVVGTTVTDSATLAGGFQATGTVTYSVFSNGTCTGTGAVASVVTVTAGVVPNSRAVTFNATGSFAFNAVYSGDSNNNGATSACEPLTVQKVSPSIATSLSSTSPVVGTTVTDSSTLTGGFQASGTVTYTVFTNSACTAPGTVASTVTVTSGVVPNSRAVTFNATGSYSFIAAYSGDSNNNGATSACEPLTVIKTSPSISTTLSATTIQVGQSVTDSSSLTSSFQAGGTVTYNLFTNGACTAPGAVVSTVTVTGGVVPNSRAVRFNVTGSYSFNAVYSGDANNNGATSACEPLVVNPTTGVSIATTLSATTITPSASVTDSATLSGQTATASGTVTYNVFSNGSCTGTGTVASVVTVTNGVVPNSRAVTFNSTGSYAFNAVYSGDANNNGATSACEPLTVQKVSPSIATSLSSTSPVVGTTVTDSATLTGGFQATGTVTYSVFSNGACTGTGTVASVVTVTGGIVPNSRAVTFNATGAFAFQAVYSGDANNNAATSACEPLTVQKTPAPITTTLSSTSPVVGTTVTDSSTLTNGFQATGTVTYNVFANGTCTGAGSVASTVTVTNGVVPNSRAVTFNVTGSFAFNAVYSGDSNNNGATSACEPLTVMKTSPSIATSLSQTTITVGQTVTDSATLSGSFKASGTVTYVLFTNGACTGTSTVVSVVTVTNSIVPNSRAVTFNATGSYAFQASYSGDSNNNLATSACEPLTVGTVTSTIATTLSNTTPAAGGAVHDSATLSGVTATAGGTVTYNLFTNGSCTGTSSVVSVVTVTNGIVPNSRDVTFNSTGSFAFNAVYSGDVNNVGSTSACEPLTVMRDAPAIATALSATTITVGGTISDSATLTAGFQASGSVTYNLFTSGTCSGTATVVSVVTVTGGVVPNSRTVTFNSTGAFAFNAVYSGDANNNAATSACEPFTVGKNSPTIATTVSSTSVVAGTPVHDSATLTTFYRAGGTVTYNLFSNGQCTGTATVVSTVTVTNGIVPDSASVTPAAGSYAFNAVYSGDANNNGLTSACEPFTVNPAPDFSIQPSSPVTINCNAGVTCTTTIAVMSLNGFTGTISLTTNPSTGLTATLASSSLTLTPNGINSTTLSLSATVAGNYTVTVTGMSGSLSHTTAVITLHVTAPDFSLSASPTNVIFVAGGSGTSTITVTPINGFTGNVALSAVASTGITASLNPTTVTGGSGSSTLTIMGSIPGTYNVNVTGTSGSLTHTVKVTVTVTSGAKAPIFTNLTWKHQLKLSKYANTQTWQFSVLNNNTSTTIYIQVEIDGADGSGSSPFTAKSVVLAILPGQTVSGTVTQTFSRQNIGEVFTFHAQINWGVSPTSLTQVSTLALSGVPTSGSFRVRA